MVDHVYFALRNSELKSVPACRTHSVTGHLLARTLGLPVTFSNVDKKDAYLFCNCYSLSILASDAENRVINYAVARSISADDRLSFINPLLVGDNRC